jgi:hypothetical protein
MGATASGLILRVHGPEFAITSPAVLRRSAVLAEPGDREAGIRTFAGKKSACESRFCKASESAVGRLEIHAKNPIYSTAC